MAYSIIRNVGKTKHKNNCFYSSNSKFTIGLKALWVFIEAVVFKQKKIALFLSFM